MLNLASNGNSPDRSTKSTRFHFKMVPQFVNTGFQVLFHSPPGVLFTFPSQYYALSVTKEYLALGGVKENLKPCVYKLWNHFKVEPRTFCRTVRRVAVVGKVKGVTPGAEGKPSLNRAQMSSVMTQSAGADPKPGELPMSRLKLP